jgi:hypothetical protein
VITAGLGDDGFSAAAGQDDFEMRGTFDWDALAPNLGLESFLVQTPSLSASDGADNQRTPDTGESTASSAPTSIGETSAVDATAGDPNARCVKTLSTVMVSLDTIWYTIVHRTSVHIPFDDSLEKHSASLAHVIDQKKLLETVFEAAQQLIEAYPAAVQLSLPPSQDSAAECQLDNCIHHLDLPPTLRKVEDSLTTRRSKLNVDVSLSNLLIASHHRLLDVLDSAIALSLSCFRVTIAHPNWKEPDYDVPDLRVGSFTPPRAASAFMQAALMRHFLQRLTDATDKLYQAAESHLKACPTQAGKVLMLQAEMLKERQAEKSQQLGSIADELVRFGLPK